MMICGALGGTWSYANGSMGNSIGSESRWTCLLHQGGLSLSSWHRCCQVAFHHALLLVCMNVYWSKRFNDSWGFNGLSIWGSLMHHAFISASKSRDGLSCTGSGWPEKAMIIRSWSIAILDTVEELHGLVLQVGSRGLCDKWRDHSMLMVHHHRITRSSSSLIVIAIDWIFSRKFAKTCLVFLWSLDILHNFSLVIIGTTLGHSFHPELFIIVEQVGWCLIIDVVIGATVRLADGRFDILGYFIETWVPLLFTQLRQLQLSLIYQHLLIRSAHLRVQFGVHWQQTQSVRVLPVKHTHLVFRLKSWVLLLVRC